MCWIDSFSNANTSYSTPVSIVTYWQRFDVRWTSWLSLVDCLQLDGSRDLEITWTSRARESSVTHKSVITDHAVVENHVIDWDKAKVVDREAQQHTRWIKEALWIRKTAICMNQEAGSYQLSHTWGQVISRSRAPSSCRQSTRLDQDRNVVIM